MNRLITLTASSLAAVGIAAAPAVLGLTHNASFSHDLPVRVPVGAQSVHAGDDHALTVASKTTSKSATPTRSATPSSTATPRHSEPGDDKGGLRTTAVTEPGDDHGVHATTEPGDDKGGLRTTATTPRPSATPSTTPDDHGGKGSGGSNGKNGGHDDPTGHH